MEVLLHVVLLLAVVLLHREGDVLQVGALLLVLGQDQLSSGTEKTLLTHSFIRFAFFTAFIIVEQLLILNTFFGHALF